MRKQESDLWCADGVWIYLCEAGWSVLLVCEVSGGEREGILRGGEETSRADGSGQFVCLSGVRETGLLCVL